MTDRLPLVLLLLALLVRALGLSPAPEIVVEPGGGRRRAEVVETRVPGRIEFRQPDAPRGGS